MGRIKDIFIDLQNAYGENLEDLPKGFSLEKYIADKKSEELLCQKFKRLNKEKEGICRK